MTWIILAILGALMFATYQGFSKLLSKDISIFLVTAYASLAGAIIMIIFHFFTSVNKSLYLNSKNFLLASFIGIIIALGNFFVIKAYSIGALQSTFSSVMYPLVIIFGVLAGVLFWHEKINLWQLLGILLSVVGIVLVFYFKDSSELIN